MRKRRNSYILCLMLLTLLTALVGCADPEEAPKYETIVLNSADTFYSNGTLLEANVRELRYNGNDASVRIRLTNIGDDPIDGVNGYVRFLNSDGEVLFEEPMQLAFEAALYKGEAVSVNISCSGRDVRKIAAVSVTG